MMQDYEAAAASGTLTSAAGTVKQNTLSVATESYREAVEKEVHSGRLLTSPFSLFMEGSNQSEVTADDAPTSET